MNIRGFMCILAYIVAVLCASGCMDQDPFGASQRKVSGPYRLMLFESGAFYLLKDGQKESGGGCIEGTVEQIGWTNGMIFAKRNALFGGDPDGWMVIDVRKESISGPLTDDEFNKKYPDVLTMLPRAAWKRL